jgi:hypothetical protein
MAAIPPLRAEFLADVLVMHSGNLVLGLALLGSGGGP